MATRFDRVTQPTTPDREERRALVPRAEARVVPGARVLPVRPLAAAMGTWLTAVLAVCYVGAPLALGALGVTLGALYAFAAVPAFVLTSFVALVAVLTARPAVQLATAKRDPVLAAVAGVLGASALAQAAAPALLPSFASMSGPQLVAFGAVGLVEASLLGVMFASFTSRPSVAFALGAGFKLTAMGLALTILRLMLLGI